MTALLPCPFCGRPPIINRIAPHTHNVFIKALSILPDHPGSVVIECVCGCGLMDATEEAVTVRWNQRIATPATLRAHVFRELVNDLRDIAVAWHPSQQLRERISGRLRRDVTPAAPTINPRPEGDHK